MIYRMYREGAVSLTGYFRSHTVAKSYLGDIVSLYRLQDYLCEATGSSLGSLVVHSGSVHIRKKNDEHQLAERMLDEVNTRY